MQNSSHRLLIDVVKSWYLRKWRLLRALAFGCVGLVSLVLLITIGATLEGSSSVAVPLTLALVLGAPTFLLARYAHRRVTKIDTHKVVSALSENPGDVAVVERSWTVVPDLSVAGLLTQRKERLPCLKLRVGSSAKRYLIPMSEDQCESFLAWLGSPTSSSVGEGASL